MSSNNSVSTEISEIQKRLKEGRVCVCNKDPNSRDLCLAYHYQNDNMVVFKNQQFKVTIRRLTLLPRGGEGVADTQPFSHLLRNGHVVTTA